jgi:hypothetical protein
VTHDNPYAAPQTSLTRVEPAALPLAEGVALGRQLFPETSTRELTRLANWNVFIDSMSLLWGVFFCFAGLAFSVALKMDPLQWFWGAAVLLSGLRLWGGSRRTPIFWGYNLLLDAGFLLGMVWAIVRLAQIDQVALFLAGSVALVLLLLAGASVAGHLVAKPLYGRYPQRELNGEVRYRERNRIE